MSFVLRQGSIPSLKGITQKVLNHSNLVPDQPIIPKLKVRLRFEKCASLDKVRIKPSLDSSWYDSLLKFINVSDFN